MLFIPFFSLADVNCEAKYIYNDNNFITKGADYTWMKDYELYNGCKTFCDINDPKDSDKTECKLEGENIEESKYKNIYLEVRHKICRITMIKIKNGDKGERVEIRENAQSCKDEISKIYWCKDGTHTCTSSYGS